MSRSTEIGDDELRAMLREMLPTIVPVSDEEARVAMAALFKPPWTPTSRGRVGWSSALKDHARRRRLLRRRRRVGEQV